MAQRNFAPDPGVWSSLPLCWDSVMFQAEKPSRMDPQEGHEVLVLAKGATPQDRFQHFMGKDGLCFPLTGLTTKFDLLSCTVQPGSAFYYNLWVSGNGAACSHRVYFCS